MRCPECRAEFLVAFRCKGRLFCPSCHARRLAEVAHRQVVYRTLREYVQAGLGERDAVPGVFGACRASARSYTGTRTGSR